MLLRAVVLVSVREMASLGAAAGGRGGVQAPRTGGERQMRDRNVLILALVLLALVGIAIGAGVIGVIARG